MSFYQRRRFRADKSRAIEQERSRIARGLHDELGSQLTEINMRVAGRQFDPDPLVR